MTRIYAAFPAALLVVREAGEGWRADRRLVDRRLRCVAASPDAPERVFCGTFDAGLHRSTDAGETFTRVGRDALADRVLSLAVDPTDPTRIWAGAEPSTVFRSTDGGDTWTACEGLTDLPSATRWSYPPRPATHHVRWLEPDPADPDHLYVGIEAGALVQTRDGGETWEDHPTGARRDNHALTTHPDAPGRAWSAAGDGYAETRDAGRTWTHPQEGLDHRYCWSVALDPADPDTVVLSSASGPRAAHTPDAAESYVYRRRGDEPWERLDDRGLPMGSGVLRAVLARGRAPGELYAVTNRGLYRTADAGDEWTELDTAWPSGFESQAPRGLVVVPGE